jgi:hypothetical protein
LRIPLNILENQPMTFSVRDLRKNNIILSSFTVFASNFSLEIQHYTEEGLLDDVTDSA